MGNDPAPASASARLSVIAIGGYGRRTLFPFSDIDLLFLHADRDGEDAFKDPIQELFPGALGPWIKAGSSKPHVGGMQSLRSGKCGIFNCSSRLTSLSGKSRSYTRLREKTVPALVMRESQQLVQRLVDVTRSRHARYGNTLFHLEPNIKDAPGGLRDYNCSLWLALISAIDNQHTSA